MKAVLFIHGFMAKEEDNRYFFDQLGPNIKLYYFQLPGHDGTYPKLNYQDWIEKAEEELKLVLKEYPKVTLVGHSMGGVIASYLAAKYSQVEKLVLLAPAFYYGNIKEWVVSGVHRHEEQEDLIIPKYHEKLSTYPKHYFLEFLRLLKKLRPYIQKVKCPTLILHGMRDHIISLKASRYAYQSLKGEKYLTLLPNIRHRILESSNKQFVASYIESYILDENFIYKKVL